MLFSCIFVHSSSCSKNTCSVSTISKNINIGSRGNWFRIHQGNQYLTNLFSRKLTSYVLPLLALCTTAMLFWSSTSLFYVHAQSQIPTIGSISVPPPVSSSSNVFMEYADSMRNIFSDYMGYFADNLIDAASNMGKMLSADYSPNTLIPIYDYIVVGAGAAGAPVARTLADGIDGETKSVLLIERGSARSKEKTPNAMDIYGAGIAIGDPEITQLLITSQGVRSHIGSVMGGGTSINMAIAIEETEEYFDYLNTFEGVNWDKDLVKECYEWVSSRVISPMPISKGYGEAWVQGLSNQGFVPNNGYLDGSPSLNPSDSLLKGHSWQGASLFNSSDNFFRNAADVLIGGSKAVPEDPVVPETLTILTKHTALRVEFDTPIEELPDRNGFGILKKKAPSTPPSQNPRATCVTYRPTTPADTATINSRASKVFGSPVKTWIDWLNSLLDPLSKITDAVNRFQPPPVNHEKRACVRKGGEIILSSGAILTPAILFKSGVGPRHQIKELRVPLVKDIPSLGQSISDRVLIPIGLFREAEADPSAYPTRICQAIGAKNIGPDCTKFGIGDRNLKCTLATAEELGGYHIGEHAIYTTRFVFPPEYRDHPLIEYVFNIVSACADGKNPFDSVLLAPTCVLAQPIIDCFRRVVANFYFTAEPKSRGYIHMDFNGDIQVNANYMKDEQDLFDAVRGVSNLIKIANSDVYRGILQESSESSCPVTVLNSLLDLVLHISSEARPVVPHYQMQKLFEVVQSHLNDLVPTAGNAVTRENANGEETIKAGIGGHEYVGDDVKCQPSHRMNNTETCDDNIDVFRYVYGDNADTRKFPFSLVEPTAKSSNMTENSNGVEAEERRGEFEIVELEDDAGKYDQEKIMGNLSRKQMLKVLRGFTEKYDIQNGTSISREVNDEDSKRKVKNVNNIEDRYNIDNANNSKIKSTNGTRSEEWTISKSPAQWVASYPPKLPDPDNPADVAKYVLTYMTSIWHWTGSARMGEVVDNNFNIKGLEGISIIDASVMNQVTRMNPTATLMMFGRYAGIKKLEQAKENMVQ